MIYLFSDSVNMLESQPVIPSEIILENEVTKELNGFNSVYIEYVAGEVDVTEAKYVVFMDSNNNFQMYKILRKGTKGSVSYIEGVHKFLDDLKASDFFIEFEETDVEPKVMIESALSSTKWVLDNSDTFPSGNISLEEVSPLEVLEEVLKKFPIEIDYWIEFDSNSIVSQRYALKSSLGVRKNKFYEYGSNVLNIEVEHNTSEIYTAAIGLGATIENENNAPQEKEERIDFSNVVWSKSSGNPLDKPKGSNMLVDDQATIRHGYFENGKYKPRITYVVFDEIKDPKELIKETHKWLVFQTLPKAVYRVEVFDGENVDLGDEVAVRYADIGVSKWTKVSMTKENLIAGKKDIYFGDVGYFNSNTANNKIEGEIDTLKKGFQKYSRRIYELKLSFDKEFTDRVTAIENDFQLKLDTVTNEIQADKEAFELRYKADKEALSGEIQDSYTNAVTEANRIVEAKETDFKNYADGIGSAANGRIDDLYEGFGDINQTVSDVVNKADYLDGVYTDLSTQTGQVSSTVANIIDGKAPAGSVLRQTTDSVLNRVWEQDISTAGSTNLLRYSRGDTLTDWVKWGTVSASMTLMKSALFGNDETYIRFARNDSPNYGGQTPKFYMQANQTYVISFDFKSLYNSGYDLNYLHLRKGDKTITTVKALPTIDIRENTLYGDIAGEGARVYFTFSHDEVIEDARILIGMSNDIENTGFGIKRVKIEKGTIPTPWSESDLDTLKYTDLVMKSDGFMLGSFELGGDKIAQAIVGKAGAIDLIADNVNFTGNVNVANQIKAYSLEAVYADIAKLRTNILTANSVEATALKVDTALINKLNTNSILTNYLIADTAMINNIKSKSLEAVYADISELRTRLLVADLITADMLKADNAMFEKLTSSTAFISSLTSKSAFIRDIQAIDLTANQVRVAYNGITPNVTITPTGITIKRPDGADYIVNGVPKMEMEVQRQTFMSPGVTFTGQNYVHTGSTSYLVFEAIYTVHQARYMTVHFVNSLANESDSASIYMNIRIRGFSHNSQDYVQTRRVFVDKTSSVYTTVTIDLGIPTYKGIQFYLEFSMDHDRNRNLGLSRVNRVFLHG